MEKNSIVVKHDSVKHPSSPVYMLCQSAQLKWCFKLISNTNHSVLPSLNPYFFTHFIVMLLPLIFFLIRFWCYDLKLVQFTHENYWSCLCCIHRRRHLRSKFIANLVNSGVNLLLHLIPICAFITHIFVIRQKIPSISTQQPNK